LPFGKTAIFIGSSKSLANFTFTKRFVSIGLFYQEEDLLLDRAITKAIRTKTSVLFFLAAENLISCFRFMAATKRSFFNQLTSLAQTF
jgi:hypothetical protein